MMLLMKYHPGIVCKTLSPRPAAFTLIELLVVISIIALLIGILLPALSAVREQARSVTCAQNLQQVGVAIYAYAGDHRTMIPSEDSADADTNLGYVSNLIATQAIYIASSDDLVGVGMLVDHYISNEIAMFCPADDSNNATEELAKIQDRNASASSSYFYRQLDQIGRNKSSIDDLGQSAANLDATALMLDANSLLDPLIFGSDAYNVNHKNRYVNVLYRDGHVSNYFNSDNSSDGVFSIRNQDYTPPLFNPSPRFDEIFVRADYGLQGDPMDAPAPASTP